MTKTSIGMVLNQLVKEANLSAIHVAERLGRTRQNVYLDLKRTSMRDEQIQEYAKALGIDKQAIYDRWEGTEKNPASQHFGEQVLEDIKRMIEEELREKNDQIRSLQESLKDAQEIIKMALGKPEPATVMSIVWSSVDELDSENVKPMYDEPGLKLIA